MVAGFGTKLLGKPSHEYLTKLLDYEIKLLESIKKALTAKLKLDISYSNQLIQLASSQKVDHPDYDSGIYKAWDEILGSFSSHGHTIRKGMDAVQTDVIDKINVLIRDKISIKKYYVESRERMDNNLIQTIHTELDKKYNSYQKLDVETNAAKKNFQITHEKGNVRNAAKAADKYRKVTMKFHLSHNAYVVQLYEARSHQKYYREKTLPEFLTGMEDLEVEFVRTIKTALSDYLKQSSPQRQEMVAWQQRCEDITSYIDPMTEYQDFVDQKKSNLEMEVRLDFEAMTSSPEDLPSDDVVLNTLTIQGIETTANDLNDDIKQLNEQIDEEKKKLNDLCNDIEKIKQDFNKFSLMSKQLLYSQTEVEKSNLVRIKRTYEEISTYLMTTLDKLGDSKPPAGLQLPQFTPNESMDYSNRHLGSSVGAKLTQMKGFLSNKISGSVQKSPTHQTQENKMFDDNKSVQQQQWFHGQLSREDTSAELIDDGDFLLRESKNLQGEMVLSTRHSGEVYHFKINSSSTTGEYMFEGVPYESIVKLIEHYYESRLPITSKRGCLLLNPIIRDKWKLSHDNVEILDLLGQGNFGNVHKGYIRSRDQYVAVKTCRESVDASTRTKFLAEAKILKGYDHRNIVKLIGVATDREPIYIVMELVQGGDLRKFLEKEGSSLTNKNLMEICRDACAGLAYLEQKKCIHRDVAARNCLVNDDQIVKITDFGMSREEEDGVYNVSGRLRAVPMKWTAPEAMNYGKFTHASDMWSYGILSWEVYSLGDSPYPRMTNQQARDYVERGDRMQRPHRCPQSFYDQVMMASWSYKPEKRPTFAQLNNTIELLITYEK